MSEYTMDDVSIEMKGNEVVDIQVGKESTGFEKMTRDEVMKMVLASVGNGDRSKDAKVWSDYFSDEESTRLFLVLTGSGWKICDNYNLIIRALHDKRIGEFYHVNIDDNCI